LGGPVIVPHLYDGKDKTFYFISYEGLRLLLPGSEDEYTPTQAFRNYASLNVLPFLNAVPLPSPNLPPSNDGCTVTDPSTGLLAPCDGQFYVGYSFPENLDAYSARLDVNLSSRVRGFIRYSDTPSSEVQGFEDAQVSVMNTHTWTLGLVTDLTRALVNDFRFNYTLDDQQSIYSLQAKGGAVPFQSQLVIPPQYSGQVAADAGISTSVPGSQLNLYTILGGETSLEHQHQWIDSLSWAKGRHGIKIGLDWRRLTPTYSAPYDDLVIFDALSDIQSGYASNLQVTSTPLVTPVFDNVSLYVQDHWIVVPRLSVDYGLRWEFNPPPGPANGLYPLALTSSNIATTTVAPIGTPLYKTSYNHFAPRFGFAWNVFPEGRHPLTLRGGFGIFYDTGQSVTAGTYLNTFPYTESSPYYSEVQLPLSVSILTPPANPAIAPPYGSLGTMMSPDLTLPYTEQWNLTIDESLNSNNVLAISYVGNVGRKLLFSENLRNDPYDNPNFNSSGSLEITTNSADSNYNALQVQDSGRIVPGLDIVGSFTLAHALDNASEDASLYSPQYGNSDFDLRRVFNLALNYKVPLANGTKLLRSVTNGWLLANRFSAQSGYPAQIYQAVTELPQTEGGGYSYFYPDLVSGVPIYLHGSAAHVASTNYNLNWRLNPAAFACTPTNSSTPCHGTPTVQGDLGRNYIRQPSFWALNTSLQRDVPIYERLHLNARLDAFNILNHPNPSSVIGTLSSSEFGELSAGSIAEIGTNNGLYAMGAARSLQLSLKLQF
jgi:hypothetical protein